MNEPAQQPAAAAEGDRARPLPVRPTSRTDEPPPAPAVVRPAAPQQPAPSRPAQPPRQEQERRPPAPPKPEPPTTPPPAAPDLVRFQAEGSEWVATAVGQGSSGRGPGTAPLVLLTFARADRPSEPVREILCVGREASRFSEGELEELFLRAKPFVRSPKKQPIFSETRGGKKDR